MVMVLTLILEAALIQITRQSNGYCKWIEGIQALSWPYMSEI